VLVLVSLTQWLSVLSVFGPRLQEHFSITNRQLGTLYGCGTLGALLVLPLVGLIVERLGIWRVLQLSAFGVGTALMSCGIVRSLVLFELSLVAAGASGGVLSVTATSLLVGLYPSRKRRVLSISLAVYSVPGIVLPLLAQYLVSLAAPGDRQAFALVFHGSCAAAGLLMLAGVLVFTTAGCSLAPHDTDARPALTLRMLWLWPTPLIILLAGLHGASDQVLYQWLPRFMTGTFDVLPVPPGLALSLAACAYVLGRGWQATLPEGAGQRAFLALSGPLGGLLILAGLWKGTALQVGLVYPLAALLWCLEYPALVSEIEFLSAGYFSTVLAAASLAQYALGVSGTNAAGWIADRTGSLQWALTPAALGFVLFGVAAALAGMGRRPRLGRPSS